MEELLLSLLGNTFHSHIEVRFQQLKFKSNNIDQQGSLPYQHTKDQRLGNSIHFCNERTLLQLANLLHQSSNQLGKGSEMMY